MTASRGSIGVLLAGMLAWLPAMAQPARPGLLSLVLDNGAQTTHRASLIGVDDTSVPALANAAARAVTSAFIGRPIDATLLADIRERLSAYYASIGRPFVAIGVPGQDVADGTLHVTVVETKLGRIKVEGNRWFGDQVYAGAIRTPPGGPIDTTKLAGDADWINRDGHRQATISVGPGDDPSTYDVTIRAKDRLPLDLTLAMDNTGTAETGLYRIGLAMDWSNALWRGDDLNYGFLASPDQFRLLENALSYTAYLPWRDTVAISAVIADTHGMPTGASSDRSMNGHAMIVSLRYGIGLPPMPGFAHHIDLGYDFKSTDSNVLSGGNSIFPTTSELSQFLVSYTAQRGDRLGQTSMTGVLVVSPGHLTPRNTASALAAQQPGASPSYVYARINIERLTNLPLGMAWDARFAAQYSDGALLPSEQLAFGGVQSIRGFMELGATRDEGVLMQNELRFAPLALPGQAGTGTIVPYAFLDLGAGRNHLTQMGASRSWLEMASAGPGLTWRFATSAALRLSWGFPLLRNGHTGLFLGPQFGTQITF